jgi:glycosyltransferase involved in cell wall biosynthesis
MEASECTRAPGLAASRSRGAVSDLRAAVIVPVRGRGPELERLLELLAHQSLGREAFELIIGDDGSPDGLGDTRARHPHAHVVAGPPRNSYVARNRGARAASAPVLAFCDSDCEPEPDWLAHGLERLEDADLVAGRVRFVAPRAPTVWTLLDIDKFLDQERAVAGGHAATANLLVRRELFERMGGFAEEFASGGDFEFVQRCVAAGARLAFAPDVVVSHPTLDSGRAFLAKVWRVHSRRAPERPLARNAVPVVTSVLGRLRRGRPVGLDPARLAAHGLEAGRRQRALALVVLHSAVPAVEFAAQVRSWLRGGRRPARQRPAKPAA